MRQAYAPGSPMSIEHINLGTAYAGHTVTVKFTGAEDVSLQTPFVIDGTALTVS